MTRASSFGFVGCAAALLLTGCASTETAMYNQKLGRAEARVEQAEQAGAYEHGSAEFNTAKSKLVQAKQVARDGDEGRAARLADEAALDAELAQAIAQNDQMQSALAELRAGIETLRAEIARGL